MHYYIIPFIVYVLTIPFVKYKQMLIARVIILILLLVYFRKYYKFKLEFDMLAVLIGFVTFFFWIFLEGYYSLFGGTFYVPTDNIYIFFRILSFVVITPLIEEFFTRNFLARILIKNDWQKVPLGKFTATSFIITVLFFGFSHNRWLPGLITGVIFNYLIYKRRNMSSVVLAHTIVNILLAIYVIYTKSWSFW